MQAETSDLQLGVSKKDAAVRRRELLGSGPGSLAAGLCSTCADHARELLDSKAGGDLFAEVRLRWRWVAFNETAAHTA